MDGDAKMRKDGDRNGVGLSTFFIYRDLAGIIQIATHLDEMASHRRMLSGK